MTEQYHPNLGELCHDNPRRDAVHIAVAPVKASEELSPGQHVGILMSGRAAGEDHVKPVGIVDPFLRNKVQMGEVFWLILYPNTITDLRHVWSHPAFKVKVPEVKS